MDDVNNELERVRKERIVSQLKVLPLHLAGQTEENDRHYILGGVSAKIRAGT